MPGFTSFDPISSAVKGYTQGLQISKSIEQLDFERQLTTSKLKTQKLEQEKMERQAKEALGDPAVAQMIEQLLVGQMGGRINDPTALLKAQPQMEPELGLTPEAAAAIQAPRIEGLSAPRMQQVEAIRGLVERKGLKGGVESLEKISKIGEFLKGGTKAGSEIAKSALTQMVKDGAPRVAIDAALAANEEGDSRTASLIAGKWGELKRLEGKRDKLLQWSAQHGYSPKPKDTADAIFSEVARNIKDARDAKESNTESRLIASVYNSQFRTLMGDNPLASIQTPEERAGMMKEARDSTVQVLQGLGRKDLGDRFKKFTPGKLDEMTDVPGGGAGAFDPEGPGYDSASAQAVGMKPLNKPGDPNHGHMGSVVPVTPEQAKIGVPEGSFMILKGRKHPTFNLAVKAEEERGFEVKKIGNRYFSVPVPDPQLDPVLKALPNATPEELQKSLDSLPGRNMTPERKKRLEEAIRKEMGSRKKPGFFKSLFGGSK